MRVVKGKWVCPYSGDTITDPSKLDVDHLVPLKNAFLSGGMFWDKEMKKKFANYLKNKDHLVAVKASENRKKGAKGPEEYMPKINQCWYLKTWLDIKKEWNLKYSPIEVVHIHMLIRDYQCKNIE
jgi:hypothetical protein